MSKDYNKFNYLMGNAYIIYVYQLYNEYCFGNIFSTLIVLIKLHLL